MLLWIDKFIPFNENKKNNKRRLSYFLVCETKSISNKAFGD